MLPIQNLPLRSIIVTNNYQFAGNITIVIILGNRLLPPQNLPLCSINVIITNSPGTNLTEVTFVQ